MALRSVELVEDAPGEGYPYDLAAVRSLPLAIEHPITLIVGPNGSGKSTLIEAIAVAAGFNPEGGSGQVQFETHPSHSALADDLRLVWGNRLSPGWFLRAESFYNVASYRDQNPSLRGPNTSYHGIRAERGWSNQVSVGRVGDRNLVAIFPGRSRTLPAAPFGLGVDRSRGRGLHRGRLGAR